MMALSRISLSDLLPIRRRKQSRPMWAACFGSV
jgi:hypothetical protein